MKRFSSLQFCKNATDDTQPILNIRKLQKARTEVVTHQENTMAARTIQQAQEEEEEEEEEEEGVTQKGELYEEH